MATVPHGVSRDAAIRSIELIAAGEQVDFEAVIGAGAVNHEAAAEPPACRVRGPEGFYNTALWLRAACADLEHRIEHVVSEADLVVVDTTMIGRHVGPFVTYRTDGRINTAWAPTGKSFAVRQSHWLRVTDGLVAEHWAMRDDLGQSVQLGWIPPTPVYLLRCARAKQQAIKARHDRPGR